MSNKLRLDSAVFELGISESREKAKALIMAGQIYVNGMKAIKPGVIVNSSDKIELRGNTLPYVSRGGLKLEKAMEVFPITLSDKVCMDIGASTGGFTDCMLQNGAVKVYSIDVGYGQLAWKLRSDSRVVNLERTNFRYVTSEQIPESIDFASIDVSFISLKLIFPALMPLLKTDGECVCLVKPQFEAGKDKVGKKGVVRERSTHVEVIENVIGYASDNGFSVLNLDFSPVKGPEGNIEYLLYIKKAAEKTCAVDSEMIGRVVESSHNTLDKNNVGSDTNE